jgi:hypothetical protein
MGIERVINGVCYLNYGWLTLALPLSITNFLVKMGIPLLIYTGCYVSTFVSLRRRARNVVTMATTATAEVTSSTIRTTAANHYSRASHNVAVTVLYTILIHVVAWSGNQVQVLMSAFRYPVDPSEYLYQILLLAMYTNNCMNPLIYVTKYRDFRRAVWHCFVGCRKSYRT